MINRILIIAILLFMSCDEEVVSSESIYGCTDETACNFDSNATIYVPNSCDYQLDDCGVCGGNNSSCDDFLSILLTDAFGNDLGVISTPRRLKLFADTGEAYGSTDFFDVHPESGAEININIDNE